MDIQRELPGVHWVWGGGISLIYEVHPRIVVKVAKSGQEEKDKFRKELKIYEILSRHPPCPSLVQCFYYTIDGIFLEYMRGTTPIGSLAICLLTAFIDISLAYRQQFNLTRDPETRVVTKLGKLEPLALRKSC